MRPSFIPPEPFRALRDLTRYRKALAEERSREVQRLHKVLEDAGVKLSSVASHVLTKSGRAMIDALIAGERDTTVLAEMAKGRLRSKIPQLQDALAGRFNEHHALIASSMLAPIDQIDTTIQTLGDRIDELLDPYEAAVTLLVTIPGVSRRTAQVILAEIGADMSRFPTAGHLASWAGMCPGNNESAGKRKSGRTTKGSKWLRKALIEAGQAAGRSKNTYLAAQYAQIRGRRGPQRAAVAVGHSILVIAWHLLTNGEATGLELFDVVLGRFDFVSQGIQVRIGQNASGLGLVSGHVVGSSPVGSRSLKTGRSGMAWITSSTSASSSQMTSERLPAGSGPMARPSVGRHRVHDACRPPSRSSRTRSTGSACAVRPRWPCMVSAAHKALRMASSVASATASKKGFNSSWGTMSSR